MLLCDIQYDISKTKDMDKLKEFKKELFKMRVALDKGYKSAEFLEKRILIAINEVNERIAHITKENKIKAADAARSELLKLLTELSKDESVITLEQVFDIENLFEESKFVEEEKLQWDVLSVIIEQLMFNDIPNYGLIRNYIKNYILKEYKSILCENKTEYNLN